MSQGAGCCHEPGATSLSFGLLRQVAKPLITTVVGVTTEAGPGGVTVVEMSKDGAGFQAGLRVGDILLTVQGEACVSPEQTSGLLRAAEGAVRVCFQRPPPERQGSKKGLFKLDWRG